LLITLGNTERKGGSIFLIRMSRVGKKDGEGKRREGLCNLVC